MTDILRQWPLFNAKRHRLLLAVAAVFMQVSWAPVSSSGISLGEWGNLRRQLSWHCFAHGWQCDEGFDQAAYCLFSFLSIVEAKNCTFSDMHAPVDVLESNYVKKV
jgi:hypothetical protein